MSGAVPPLPQYAFMAWSSVKAQGQLYLCSLCVISFSSNTLHICCVPDHPTVTDLKILRCAIEIKRVCSFVRLFVCSSTFQRKKTALHCCKGKVDPLLN
jgi:hypothetical protein